MRDPHAALVISLSGGKDSQGLASALRRTYDARRWVAAMYAIHMDLGRAEWSMSMSHTKRIADDADMELVIIARPQGDLVDQIEQRMIKLHGTGKPFWPSSAARYCTSDQKRNQADKVLRRHMVVISAEGIRAGESRDRSKKPVVAVRKQITSERLKRMSVQEAIGAAQPHQRIALNWYPLLHWSEEDVWNECGTSRADLERRRELYKAGDEWSALNGWPFHPAYVYGNERVSCALCVLATKSDLRVGIRHNPDLAQTYAQFEAISGFSFKKGVSISELMAEDENDF